MTKEQLDKLQSDFNYQRSHMMTSVSVDILTLESILNELTSLRGSVRLADELANIARNDYRNEDAMREKSDEYLATRATQADTEKEKL